MHCQNQIMLLQKAALRVILKIPPRNHVSSNFQRLQIMPVSMLLEYRYVLMFLKQVREEQITPKINKNEKTRSSAKFPPQRANNCRGERSLLTMGVSLFNSYLMGEEGVGLRVCGLGWRVLCGRVVCRGHLVDGASLAADRTRVSSVLFNRVVATLVSACPA